MLPEGNVHNPAPSPHPPPLPPPPPSPPLPPLGLSIVNDFGKVELTYRLPFQGCINMTLVNGKVPPTNTFTCMPNYLNIETRENREKNDFSLHYLRAS